MKRTILSGLTVKSAGLDSSYRKTAWAEVRHSAALSPGIPVISIVELAVFESSTAGKVSFVVFQERGHRAFGVGHYRGIKPPIGHNQFSPFEKFALVLADSNFNGWINWLKESAIVI
jgi:hypothetical protein